jgi:hypothetical protein
MTSELLCERSESFFRKQANSPESLASPVSVAARLSCADQVLAVFSGECAMKRSALAGARAIASCGLAVLLCFSATHASAVYTTTLGVTNDFVEPGLWTVGAADSTYQEWDNLGNSGGNPGTARAPDTTNPRGPSSSGSSYFSPGSPTIAAHTPIFGPSTGFAYGMVSSSTHNFYALDTGSAGTPPSHTGGRATIFNYGTGDPGEGTYVKVQSGLTLNDGVGFMPGTFRLVDNTTGLTIPGGATANAVVTQLNLYTGLTVNPPDAASQTVDYEELLHEFFLPNYFGNFRVEWDQEWSTSLDVLRVDTFIGPAPLEAISPAPEPASAVAWMLMFGTVGLVQCNRRNRTTKA